MDAGEIMVFAPIRGIFMLGRTAFIVAAAAAIPILLKKNRKLADQVGDTLKKAGERLKQEYGSQGEASDKGTIKDSAGGAAASKPPAAKAKVKPAAAQPVKAKGKVASGGSAKTGSRAPARAKPKAKPSRKKPAAKPPADAA